MSFSLGNTNIGDIYYGATKITNAYLGSTHVYQSLKPITLTLCAAEGGTLTADTITGFPGDTIELAPTYDTYWRLSGYEVYGDGSVSDNTYTFGNDDEQIVSAYYKKNNFFVSGRFTHITAATATGNRFVKHDFYAYKTYSSGNASIPSTFYATKTSYMSGNKIGNKTASTTNVWQPTGTISGYIWSGYCNTDAFQKLGLGANRLSARSHHLLVNSTNFGSTGGTPNGTTTGRTILTNNGTTTTLGYVHNTASLMATGSWDYWLTNQSYTTANSLWWASGYLP